MRKSENAYDNKYQSSHTSEPELVEYLKKIQRRGECTINDESHEEI